MERIVRFKSNNRDVFGILHTPDKVLRQRSMGIIMSCVWVKYRVGPHRMFVQAARQWCLEGFHVLRVDMPGMGDSDGDDQYPNLDDYPVQTPLDAIRYLKEFEGVEEVILFGVCSGARNMIYAAEACPEVRYVILLSMPFNKISVLDNLAEVERLSPVVVKREAYMYLKLLLKPNAWRRLLTGQSNYVAMKASIKSMGASLVNMGGTQKFYGRIYNSMRAFFERRGHALFLFGEKDELYMKDFTNEFEQMKKNINGINLLSDVLVIKGANHTFDRVDWKKDAISYITLWLKRQFPIK